MQETASTIILLQQIGEVLRKARRRRGQTLAAMAQATGLTTAVLKQIEKGTYTHLSLQMLHMLVGHYRVGGLG